MPARQDAERRPRLRARGVGGRYALPQAKRIVRQYQRCLNSEAGRNARCYRRVETRCVRPTFLGRCWMRDRFFRRRVGGYACTERRAYEVRGLYEGRVLCRHRTRRISHRYTLLPEEPLAVTNESELRAAWSNPRVTAIDVKADIFLRACELGDPLRESARPVLLDGHGHTLRQTCFEKRLLRSDGTGFVELRNVTLTRGGSDGPGGAVTTRGEIRVVDSKVHENLAEEPGGGIMSQRRATIVRSVITGNLANDDGGGVYARRGGIQVFDSIVNGNLVDGSGGALGSTGDILVVRSHVDGNTTDGDGGAIYTDEDGDVTVIDSTVDGSTADGPGGGIWGLEGDITIVNSTVNGNRADDRGGGIGGEADVTIINSTIARNAAVAHVGGGIWSRSDAFIVNSTISDNYAEGVGGGILAAGIVGLVKSTVIDNVAPSRRTSAPASGWTPSDRLSARRSSTQSAARPADREELPGAAVEVLRLQLRHGRVVRPGHRDRHRERHRPMLGELGRERRPRRDPPPPDGQPGAGPHPGGRLQLPALRGRARGRAAPGRARCGSSRARRHRSARRSATPGTCLRRRCRGGGEMTHRFRPRLLRALTVAVLCGCAAAVALGFGEPAGADAGRKAEAAGEDSPWPRTNAVRPNMRVLRQELARLAEQVELMEQSAENYEDWQTCLRYVPVNEQGDRDRQSGYLYDERDGTGVGFMDGIAVDRRRRWGREDYLFIHFSRAAACRNESTQPGGTAEPASVAGAGNSTTAKSSAARVAINARVPGPASGANWPDSSARQPGCSRDPSDWRPSPSASTSGSRASRGCPSPRWAIQTGNSATSTGGRALRRATARRCTSTVATGTTRTTCSSRWWAVTVPAAPVKTNQERRLTDMRRALLLICVFAQAAVCAPAALAGGDGPDRSASVRDRIEDLQEEVESLTEDIEDLAEPVEEFDLFDQCAYTIGVTPVREMGRRHRLPVRARRRATPARAGDGHTRLRHRAVRLPRLPGRGAAQHRVQRGCGRRVHRQLSGCGSASSRRWPSIALCAAALAAGPGGLPRFTPELRASPRPRPGGSRGTSRSPRGAKRGAGVPTWLRLGGPQLGDGPLIVSGRRRAAVNADDDRRPARSRDRDAPLGRDRSVGRLRYVRSPDHEHWHLLDFERYELRRRDAGPRS